MGKGISCWNEKDEATKTAKLTLFTDNRNTTTCYLYNVTSIQIGRILTASVLKHSLTVKYFEKFPSVDKKYFLSI